MRFLKLISLMTVALILCGCNQNVNTDTIIVGTSADNPPYEYIVDEQLVGFDIDLINEIASGLNKKILIKNMELSALIPALKSGHIDLIIAAISASKERRSHVDFSDVYASSTVSALTLKNKNINNIEDLKGKKVGVQLGTTWELIAKDIAKNISNIEIHSINNNLVLLEELKKNSIDAIILEDLQVKKFQQLDHEFSSFNIENYDSKYAIVFNKDSDLREKINERITVLKTTGKIHELKEKWLTPLANKLIEHIPATDTQNNMPKTDNINIDKTQTMDHEAVANPTPAPIEQDTTPKNTTSAEKEKMDVEQSSTDHKSDTIVPKTSEIK